MRIFISYRRVDSQAITDRIYEWLSEAFGKDKVFQDVYGIRAGDDFREAIRQQVGDCDVLIAVIGQQWLNITETDDGSGETRRRLENPNDSVRLEIEAGLSDRTKTLVIPVLVNDGQFPSAARLPETIRNLTNLNAAQVRNNPYFEDDMRRLIARLREHEREMTARGALTTKPKRQPSLVWGAALVAVGLIVSVILIASVRSTGMNQAELTTTPLSASNATVVAMANQTMTADAIDATLDTGLITATHIAATAQAVETATAAANTNATATLDAEIGYFLGSWAAVSTDISASLSAVTLTRAADSTLTMTYTSYCPPQGNLCYTSESTYTIYSAAYANDQVRATLENTRITLLKGADDGEIIANIRFGSGDASSVVMERRRFIIDDFSVVATFQLDPGVFSQQNSFQLAATATP